MFGEKAALGEEAYLQRLRKNWEAEKGRMLFAEMSVATGPVRIINGASAPNKAERKLTFDGSLSD
jgi:hypothetical protein